MQLKVKVLSKKKKNDYIDTGKKLTNIIKTSRDIMRKDKGLSGDLDRLPMLTWLMFLKFFDDMEKINKIEAEIQDETFKPIIEPPYRWRDWASNEEGFTGDELLSFINNDEAIRPDATRGMGLFSYLRSLQGVNENDRRDVIASVFKGINNRMINGYLIKDVINNINSIHFDSSEEIHTLAHLYENMLREMRDAAGDSGEFYTPRPIIKFMVSVVDPKLGETILDPAVGTGGFLVEAYEHLKQQCKTTNDFLILQKKSLFGGEAKPLPYLLCQMNLLLHGHEYPQIDFGNSLRFPLREIGERDRVNIILTNPPFGGEEEKEILSNFPVGLQTTETALLFLQLIMRKIKRKSNGNEGRCGIVVPDGTLFGSGVCARIKEQLLNEFNLHTIVRLPKGAFAPYTDIKTNLLFFNTEKKTERIWYYEHPLPTNRQELRNPCYTKSYPLTFDEFDPLISWWNNREENENTWVVPINDILKYNEKGSLLSANLDLRNPNKIDLDENIPPRKILDDILERETSIIELLNNLREDIDEELV